ncbi:MAG: mitochondrial fission ELM1 family protein [Pseudomonadota bacterium]
MEIESGSKPLLIWALTDGRAGNVAQALGLAEAIARQRPAAVEAPVAAPSALAAALPAALSHRLGQVLPGWPMRGYAGLPARDPRPDLIIGAGRRIAPLVAAWGRDGAKTVQVLDPQMPASAFDLVVVPEHDGLVGPRILTCLGAPGRVTPARITEAVAEWEPRLPQNPNPRLAVLIGGSGRMARWSEGDADRVLQAVTALAEDHAILATVSRRSEPGLADRLRERLGRERLGRGRHLVHDGSGDNPYPAILGLADAVLVTQDSVNMASEAACSGLPVHILRVGTPAPKAVRFHAALAERGIAQDFQGRIAQWRYDPLAEADRLAALCLTRLHLA